MAAGSASWHSPVLLDQVLTLMSPQAGDVIIDATFGAGGHSKKILECVGPSGRVIGLDQDADLLEKVRPDFSADLTTNNLTLVHANFSTLPSVIAQLGLTAVNGLLVDLGVSSYQLDSAARGFSFQQDGPLDMRMNTDAGQTVAEFIARIPEKELADIIYQYGEERRSRRIAKAIVEARRRRPISTTAELVDIITKVVPRTGKIHPATRSFQALRIAVNRELDVLKELLDVAMDCLLPGAKFAVISFHSLEDRIVKWEFRRLKQEGLIKILTKKPVQADREEIKINRRSRSAKLRVVERI